jgi:hypothetical protein
MLSLTDTRWEQLHHAFGPAHDVPGILQQLQEGNTQDKDDLFYGMLCHQYTVYDATFAAMPAVFRLLEEQEDVPTIIDILNFCAVVYAFDYEDHPASSPSPLWYEPLRKNRQLDLGTLLNIQAAYKNTAEEIEQYCLYLLSKQVLEHERDKQEVLIALAAVTGSKAIARALLIYNEDEYVCICPHCNSEVFIWNEAGTLQVYAQDPVVEKEQSKYAVTPITINTDEWDGSYNRASAHYWLADMAQRYEMTGFVTLLPQLFGVIACPHCPHTFELMPVLEMGV